MYCDMDIDVPIQEPTQRAEEPFQSSMEMIWEAPIIPDKKKTLRSSLVLKVKENQMKRYYSYLLYETLKVFPTQAFTQTKNCSLLMLEAPKENCVNEGVENLKNSEEDKCLYKRKWQDRSYPIKLMKYSYTLVS